MNPQYTEMAREISKAIFYSNMNRIIWSQPICEGTCLCLTVVGTMPADGLAPVSFIDSHGGVFVLHIFVLQILEAEQ